MTKEACNRAAELRASNRSLRRPVSTDALSAQLVTAMSTLRTIRDLARTPGISEQLESLCDRALRGERPPPRTRPLASGTSAEVLTDMTDDLRWHLGEIRQHADHIGCQTIVALVDAALGGGK